MGWIAQIDFQNVSFGSFSKLRFQVKGLHLRRFKKSKLAGGQRLTHGIPVKVVAVQICYITGIFSCHVALWKIRVFALAYRLQIKLTPPRIPFSENKYMSGVVKSSRGTPVIFRQASQLSPGLEK